MYSPELLDSNDNRICMLLVHTGIQEEVHSGLVGDDQIKYQPHSSHGQKALFLRENYGLFMLKIVTMSYHGVVVQPENWFTFIMVTYFYNPLMYCVCLGHAN